MSRADWIDAACELDDRLAKRIAEGSEGSEVCSGEHCDGQGRTLEAGDACGFCQEVEYGIWQAGEPD